MAVAATEVAMMAGAGVGFFFWLNLMIASWGPRLGCAGQGFMQSYDCQLELQAGLRRGDDSAVWKLDLCKKTAVMQMLLLLLLLLLLVLLLCCDYCCSCY